MKFYRCKCGKAKAWGSMSPQPCQSCDECGTTLASHPGGHKKPIDHKYQTDQTVRDGEVVNEMTYCRRCFGRKPGVPCQ